MSRASASATQLPDPCSRAPGLSERRAGSPANTDNPTGIRSNVGPLATRSSTVRLSASRIAVARAIEWLPAVTAAGYIALVLFKFRDLVRNLYWNSDAAGAVVLGALAHAHAAVEIPRFGWWTSLWWLFATRGLPGHVQLWEATGYAFALATVVLVGAATSRVAGVWAGVTAGATAVVVGPMTLASLLTLNFHTSTPFTAAVLAAYLVFFSRRRSWTLAAMVGVLSGLNAASDPLLWVAGLIPFALAGGFLAFRTRQRDVAYRVAGVIGVAAVCAFATDRLMSSLGFHLIPVGLQLAKVGELPHDTLEFGKSVALLFGANFRYYPTYPGDPVRYLVALLAVAALATIFIVVVRLAIRGSDTMTLVYAMFWAASVALIGLSYWGSNQAAGGGPGGGLNYMLTFAPAVGVGVALLATHSPTGRIVTSLAIAALGATNIASVANGRAEIATPHPAILPLLERKGLTRGYASFWEAQNLIWKSGLKILVAPVRACEPGQQVSELCRDRFFTIGSWYDPRPGRSFLIVDPAAFLSIQPPPSLGRPIEVHKLPTGATVYVYPQDIARNIHR